MFWWIFMSFSNVLLYDVYPSVVIHQEQCTFIIYDSAGRERTQLIFLVFQDALKTSWRRLQRNTFSSSKTSSRRICNTSSRCLRDVFKTSSRRLKDVTKTSSKRFCKTSWKTKNVMLKTSWRRLEDVFSTSSPTWCH